MGQKKNLIRNHKYTSLTKGISDKCKRTFFFFFEIKRKQIISKHIWRYIYTQTSLNIYTIYNKINLQIYIYIYIEKENSHKISENRLPTKKLKSLKKNYAGDLILYNLPKIINCKP